MAGATPAPQTEGRKSLDAEINLVPFIDLLSVCICFLLMTAVWMQIASVQVKQSHGTAAEAPTSPYELDVMFTDSNRLQLVLRKGSKKVKTVVATGETFPAAMTDMGSKLETLLATIPRPKVAAATPATAQTAAPATTVPLVSAAMVTPKAGVSYGNLVSTMDLLRKHEITNLGVIAVAEGK